MIDSIYGSIYDLFVGYGILGLFISMVIENMGVPFPIEIGYLVAVPMVLSGAYSLWFMLILLTAGHVLGALISYKIGTLGEGLAKRIFKNSMSFKKVDARLNLWYESHGYLAVFWARLIGYVRPWSSFIAGLAEYPPKQFVFWTILGSVLFNAIALLIAWLILDFWNQYVQYQSFIVIALIVLCVWLAGYYLFYKKKKNNTEKN